MGIGEKDDVSKVGFILLPIGVEFQVELHGTKKSTYRKSPKQRDSNGRPVFKLVLNYYHMQKTFFFFLTKAMSYNPKQTYNLKDPWFWQAGCLM